MTTLGWIGYPFGVLLYYIGIILLFIGKLLYGPVITFLQPFIYLGRFILFVVCLPYYLLAKFEVGLALCPVYHRLTSCSPYTIS